jgi:GNAT superfamily N-acetyltransferase
MSLSLTITMRLATRADLPKLEWHGQYRHFRRLFHRTFREQQAGRRLMLLADLNNFPIGQVFIHFRRPSTAYSCAYLYSFRVMEMFRGYGIGSQLLESAEEVVRSRNFSRAIIAVSKENNGARRLYHRLGYALCGEDPGHWSYLDHQGKVCHVHEPCWILEKYLMRG